MFVAMRWVLLVVLLASLLPSTAAACSCAPTRWILQSELADERATIFIGTVEGVKGSSRTGNFFTLERLLLVRPWLFLRGSWPERPVELWGGSIEGSGDCGAHLRTGWTYLVVAQRSDDGKLAAGQCSMTAPLFGYGILVGIPATLLLVAGALVWALWRRLRRGSSPQGPAASGRHTTAWTRAPAAWLCASGGLLALAVLLWNLAPWLSPPFEATGGGLFTETVVKGPGLSESWAEALEPDSRMFALALGILACISGALATLCCAAWVALRTWRRARSHATPS